MLNQVATYGGALVKRAAEANNFGNGNGNGGDGEVAQLPGWAVLIIFADVLVFFPVFFYVSVQSSAALEMY